MGQQKIRLTTEQFIANARAVHGDRYDYSKAVYETSKTPIEVICPEHGSFFPRPNNHVGLRSGCPQCAGCAPTTLATFLARARAVHGDRYDYSRVAYIGVQKKVEIICPDHGPFLQLPMSHVAGRGCVVCGAQKSAGSNRLTAEKFIEKATAVHGDRYDYSRVTLTSGYDKVEIVCPDHGPFWQVARYHLGGNGCPACGGVARVLKDEFIRRAEVVHGNKYDYGLTEFRGMNYKVSVRCRHHGDFLTLPKDHVAKSAGCPVCAHEATTSVAETEISDFVKSLGFEAVRNDRRALDGFEVDILVPEKRLCLEYNGAYWHTDDRMPHPRMHEMKLARAEDNGYRLLYIWDFDWEKRRGLIEGQIRNALGCYSGKKQNARGALLSKVREVDARVFYANYHIQGCPHSAQLHYGLRLDGAIIACMSFSRIGSRRSRLAADEWELIRFATRGLVRGAASRLFTAFIKEHGPKVVVSFSDRQHFGGALYPRLGFAEDGRIAADYRVIHQPPSGRIWHKSAWQRKNIPARLRELGLDDTFDPNTDPRTEREMQRAAGVYRIMDAGKIRWKWTAP